MNKLFQITINSKSQEETLQNCSTDCKKLVCILLQIKSLIFNNNSDFCPSCLPVASNLHSRCIDDFVLLVDILVYKIKYFPPSQSGILNLSDHQLSVAENELLEKGLNYCPTQQGVDLGKLNLELDRFFRSVRLALFFDGSTDPSEKSAPGSPDDQVPFSHPDMKKPSTWTPPPVSHLDHVLNMVQSDTLSHKIPTVFNTNLQSQHYAAIKSLSSNKSIVIKPADKGRKVVIQNRNDYIVEGLRQLSDSNFYTQTDNDLTLEHSKEIKAEINTMLVNGEISKQTHDYILSNCERTAQFYMLPKIHKNIISPPGRPIVSGNDCPTEKISQLVDLCINPLVPKIQSYLKDTTHLLQILQTTDKVPPGALLVTLDVTSLYTNIPHEEGIAAVADYLSRYRSPDALPSNQSLLKLLRMVLTKNNFNFNEQHFLQTNGTAMGTRVAPSYANIFMARFEEQYVYPYHLHIHLWRRYIDDIIMLWLHGKEELLKFVHYLNTRLEHIRFTVEYSHTSIVMLDTNVLILQDGSLASSLHTKDTDSHDYLRYDSDHPQHTKDSIPYSQLLRIRRICSHDLDFLFHSLVILGHFSRRGYPLIALAKTLRRAACLSRSDLLSNTSTPLPAITTTRKIFCVLTHNKHSPPVKTYVERHWPLLGRREATRCLTDTEVIYSHKRPPNLKDLLVRAKLPTTHPSFETPTCKAVNRTCKYCPLLNTSGSFTHPQTGRTHKTKYNISCQTNNVVYLLECNQCHILYVGQTKNAIMKRIYQHTRDIKIKNPKSTVARHCNAHLPTTQPPLTVHILDFITLPRKTFDAWQKRLERERMWIARLNTLVPTGLNLLE